MKKILIVCGTGIVTSTIVKVKLDKWINDKDLTQAVSLYQTSVSEGIMRESDYDIVISTTIVPDELRDKAIDGLPLLTGFGEEAVYERLLNKIAAEQHG